MAEGVFAWRDIELQSENKEANDRDILSLNYWLADRLGYTLSVYQNDIGFDYNRCTVVITDPKGKRSEFVWIRGQTWEQMMYHAMCLYRIPWWTHDLGEVLELAANYPNIRIETNKYGDGETCRWTIACWDEEISDASLYEEYKLDLKDLPVHIVRCILSLMDYRLDFDRPYPPIFATTTYGSTKLP